MASFKEHIAFSSLLGVGYGIAAHFGLGFTPTQAALSGYLAGIGGMLPDLDSATGRPVREIFSLTAAVAPLVLIGRVLRATGLPTDTETVILVMLVMYFIIRYGLSWMVSRFSTHRGMFHSFPAMCIAGEVVYLMYPSEFTTVKLLMGSGIALGFLSHLFLDEVYAVQWVGMIPKFKKSFGTAMKFAGPAFGATVFTYALFFTASFIVLQDAGLIGPPSENPYITPMAEEQQQPPQETTAPNIEEQLPQDFPAFKEATAAQEDLSDAPLFR